MPTNVLLLRAPSEDSGTDRYEDALRTRGYRALSIPVLETVHTNSEKLAGIVHAGGSASDGTGRRYAGVVVTSGRACEAWRTTIEQLQLAATAYNDTGGTGPNEGWSSVPFYAVGESTASALASIHTFFSSSPASRYAPCDIRGGAVSGTGEKLARFVVADLSPPSPNPIRNSPTGGEDDTRRKLLYLTGDKNRDTVPNILTEAGFELESLQAYATQGSSRFEDDLQTTLDGAQAVDAPSDGSGPGHWWIVYFAPSSAKHVSPILRRHFDIPDTHNPSPRQSLHTHTHTGARHARLAAIGPTTASSLQTELGLHINVVAERPTPEALAEGIARWDKENGSSV